jgi:hypothetical protein
MHYAASERIAIVAQPLKEGLTLKKIVECGVTLQPVAHAHVVLVNPDDPPLTYDAAYASLPNGTLVVVIKNESETFPEDMEILNARLILDPYLNGTPHVIDLIARLHLGVCPICGLGEDGDYQIVPDDDDGDDDSGWGDDDDDDDDDGDDDGDGFTLPTTPRFTFTPSSN